MPVAFCTFTLNRQRFSSLICDGHMYPAFSGMGADIDNPDAIAKVDDGPLPPGQYYIVDRESGGHLGWLYDAVKDFASGSDRSRWFSLYRMDGKIDDVTYIKGVKRHSFRLHPAGRFNVSEGCITLTNRRDFDALRAYLKSRPPAYIPGTRMRYYGTVTVR